MSLELVEKDLATCLKRTAWGSPEMASAVNDYLGSLLRRAGVGLALTFSPVSADVEGVDFPGSVLRLGAIQALSQVERQALFRRAWTEGNPGSAAPGLHGYKHWLTEILLEAGHRLRRTPG